MSSTFRAFQTGLMAGQQQRQVRDQEAARKQAADAFGAGNYEGASTALMKGGLYDEADAYTKAADRAKSEAQTKMYADAYKMGATGDGGTKGGYTAVRDIAGQSGDMATVGTMEKSLAQMSAQERENAARTMEFSARLAFDLSNLPPEAREEAKMRAVAQFGGAFGITPDMAAQMATDDQTLSSTMNFSLDAIDQLKMKREDQRNEIEDGFANRRIGLQERGLANDERALAIREREAQAAQNPGPDFGNENALRNQYLGQTKEFQSVRDAYSRINATQDNAAGDISLVFAYMKMLDPGSTVREGEFATAQNATGVPGQIINLYNKLQSGERLNPEQRKEFKGQANSLYAAQEQSYVKTMQDYRQLAQRYGMSPDVIVDLRMPNAAPAPDGMPNDLDAEEQAMVQELRRSGISDAEIKAILNGQ